MKARNPTKEELESIGAYLSNYRYGDPDCFDCKGAGFIDKPDRLRGGHICHCVIEREGKKE